MNITSRLLARRGNLPRPVVDWNFTDSSKLQVGSGPNLVGGWTGENLKAGIATVDASQGTPLLEPTFNIDHIEFGGSQSLNDLPPLSGDFAYVMKLQSSPASGTLAILLGTPSEVDQVFYISNMSLVYRAEGSIDRFFTVAFNLTDGVTRTFILTRSGSDITCYIDGVFVNTITEAGVFLPSSIAYWDAGALALEGDMERMIVYDSAFTQKDATAITARLA